VERGVSRSTGGRGRICLYAPYAWPLFTQGSVEFTGGAEVQQVAMARGLAARGFDVHLVTCDYGQPARVQVDGITVHRAFRPHAGLPVLRFFHPRLTRALAALAAADAEVYYVRGAGLWAGITFDLARARRAAFVFGAAHDHDARRPLPLLSNPRDRWWYRRALRGARSVVAQTEFQRALFASEFAVASEVIQNLVELPEHPGDPGGAGPVVWLATYKPSKRPEWFTELARRLPDRRFVMCGVIPIPPDTRDAWDAARRAAETLPNLEVRGYLDHARLGELFGAAALFVHTSPVEGFPNTVLESWAYGVPSVTVVDPDGVVAREGLGGVATELPALEAAVRRLLGDPEARVAAGRRARDYVARHHAPAAVLDRLAALFDRVVAGVRSAHVAGDDAGRDARRGQ
jgi:glycosyltransferase involved in cell wall biosynthesis